MTDEQHQTDGASKILTKHLYRVEVQVPRVQPRPGNETTWRTLATPQRIEYARDVVTHLRESLLISGLFDEDLVDEWLGSHVRYVEYRETTERVRVLPMKDWS